MRLSKEMLLQEYVINNKTDREIADMYGLSRQHVSRLRNQYDIPRRIPARNKFVTNGDITIIYLELKNGEIFECLVDTEDINKVKNHKWSSRKPHHTKKQYAITTVCEGKKKTSISMHRLLMNAPKDMVVDHINHNTLDNRKVNLRIVTQAQNMQNLKGASVKSKSGVRGVYWLPFNKKWRATIRHEGKVKHLGLFDDISNAESVVKAARMKLMPFSTG